MVCVIARAIAGGILIGLAASANPEAARLKQVSTVPAAVAPPQRALLDRYCITCHSERLRTAGLTLETLDLEHVGESAEVWEKVLRKLRTGTMPPAGVPHPPQGESASFVSSVEAALDRSAKEHPDPGRPAVHRLNRAEYSNAIRDLLDLDVDVASLLPSDDSALGFDNIADVLSVSPSLLGRYMSAARQIGRLALGDPTLRSAVYVVPRNLVQDVRVSEDLPLGSSGGIAIRHYFPASGEYTIKIRLQRNVMEEIRGLTDSRQVDLRIDGERVKVFSVGGEQPEAGKVGISSVHTAISTYLIVADDGLEMTVPLKAGTHAVAVTVLGQRVKPEGPFQPPITPKATDFFTGRHSGFGVGRLEIRGPNNISGPDVSGPDDTPSRRRIFVCRPSGASREAACARQILSTLARRAFRRPVSEPDVRELLASYETGRRSGTFESGIELALRRILMSPYFLFRVEQDPVNVAANAAVSARRTSSSHPVCRFSSGAASRMSSCLASRSREDSRIRSSSSNRSGECWATRDRRRC